MLIKNVKKKIINELSDYLSKFGFKYNKKFDYFIRKSPESLQIIDLIFYKNKDGSITVEPVIRIKLKRIEEIYHKVTLKDKKYLDATSTISINLGKLIEHIENGINKDTNNDLRYLIENEQDILILIKVLKDKFERYVVPYFEKYSTLKKIDEILNINPKEISIHNWLYPMRACIALIAAKLSNNPKYDELLKIYDEELEDAAENYKIEFARLKKLLESY
ncbi:hypothetical protein ACX8XN_08325 [Calditrichota bacterium GD2]